MTIELGKANKKKQYSAGTIEHKVALVWKEPKQIIAPTTRILLRS
ncbi:hypothetical protein SAMN05421827_101623 [Pedobacter terrae]|uniref:Uncharacterized protein n=1 Tax=Pedobacter terrae TaxID=405671 RepID=A0A1G7P6I2_9SPHI|nr:hypothetical protein SAMN05421827_101623 [Pedobacter terrae]